MNAATGIGAARHALSGLLPAEARRRLRNRVYVDTLFNSREPERTSWAVTDDGARLRVVQASSDAVRDELRPEAREVIDHLHRGGATVAMLTGDNTATATASTPVVGGVGRGDDRDDRGAAAAGGGPADDHRDLQARARTARAGAAAVAADDALGPGRPGGLPPAHPRRGHLTGTGPARRDRGRASPRPSWRR